MKSNWVLNNKKADYTDISNKFNISLLTSKIIVNRGINDDDSIKMMLSDNLSDMNPCELLPDIEKATFFIKEQIKLNKKIRIVGDYDADGVCSTYILYKGLKLLNANVDYIIPDRVKDGYGINISIIERCIQDKIDIIITCDNGISANEEIKFAKQNNIEVIVTDHHDIQQLPEDAYAIVDPKRTDVNNKYPFTEICGAVVSLKFIKKLFGLYDDNNLDYKQFVEFAMIATVCDIMPITNENHILVKAGLKLIKETKCKGLKKMLELSNLLDKELTTYHIGFIIGPQINASGRLRTAEMALELLLEEDDDKILTVANELKKLNDERKIETDFGEEEGLKLVKEIYENDKVLVLYLKSVKESVAGIVAGRIKDKIYKPTIVLTDSDTENVLKASCRSIESYNMFDELSKYRHLFIKFGGHKLAAGFSIDKNNLEELRLGLNKNCNLTEDDFIKKIYIDYELALNKISLALVEDIEKLKPYGNMNEKALFALRDVEFSIINIYGANKNVVKLKLKKDNFEQFATIFSDSEEFVQNTKNYTKIDILYNLSINEYNNAKKPEITIKEYRRKN